RTGDLVAGLGWEPGIRIRKRPRTHAGAGRELRMGPLGATVRSLHRTEQLLLQPIPGRLVECFVGLAERDERDADLLGAVREVIEHLLASLCGREAHPGHSSSNVATGRRAVAP